MGLPHLPLPEGVKEMFGESSDKLDKVIDLLIEIRDLLKEGTTP